MRASTPEELLARLKEEGFGRGVAGVRAIHGYSSEKFRSKLGTLEVFERAFGNDLYAPLLEHQTLLAAPPTVIGNSARSELVVTTRTGEVVTYQLGMVRTSPGTGPVEWRLSGLYREGVDL